MQFSTVPMCTCFSKIINICNLRIMKIVSLNYCMFFCWFLKTIFNLFAFFPFLFWYDFWSSGWTKQLFAHSRLAAILTMWVTTKLEFPYNMCVCNTFCIVHVHCNTTFVSREEMTRITFNSRCLNGSNKCFTVQNRNWMSNKHNTKRISFFNFSKIYLFWYFQ